jgi:hypothetical protein
VFSCDSIETKVKFIAHDQVGLYLQWQLPAAFFRVIYEFQIILLDALYC